MYIHTYIHTCMHTYTHTYINTYIHKYVHTYIHTYIHAYMHTYIHTHIHTCIHRQASTPSAAAACGVGVEEDTRSVAAGPDGQGCAASLRYLQGLSCCRRNDV